MSEFREGQLVMWRAINESKSWHAGSFWLSADGRPFVKGFGAVADVRHPTRADLERLGVVEPEFKRGELVMVRDSDDEYWVADVFERNDPANGNFCFICRRNAWQKCRRPTDEELASMGVRRA